MGMTVMPPSQREKGVLKKMGRKDHKFNLKCFVCDEGGANYKAIAMVYGADYCKEHVVGCLWHFLNDANKK